MHELLQGIAIIVIGVSVCIQGYVLRVLLRRTDPQSSRQRDERRRPGAES